MAAEYHSKARVPTIEIYTDGSSKSSGAQRFGGWAFLVVEDNNASYMEHGAEMDATNQQMELMAVAKALEYISQKRRHEEQIIIYSDSAYIVNCYLQHWYENWEQNYWRTSAGKPVANTDLWSRIIPYFKSYWYDFRKVAGHKGIVWNEKCDKAAQFEADYIKHHWEGRRHGQ